VGLVESADRASAHVVGHDWGAAVAWETALRHPDVVDRLGILNVPHPSVFEQTVRSNPRQLLRSWYMLFFQLPRIPEWLLSRSDYEPIARTLRSSSKPGTFSDQDLERYRAAWRHDGAVRSMLNWYRGLRRRVPEPSDDRVDPSTLVIWGENDEALIPEMAPKSVEYCRDGRLERFPSATHWVHHEYPDEVAELLVDHLNG
jgi:pimeloyl-ACP methyl ester carboxylesterase